MAIKALNVTIHETSRQSNFTSNGTCWRNELATLTTSISNLLLILGKVLIFFAICINSAQGQLQIAPSSDQEHEIDQRQPLHQFEKLVSESWIVTANTGTKMEHTWKWGPGKKSIERWTEGLDAQGNPWRELAIYYWHPKDMKINFLGISSFQAGITRGTIEFKGESATIDSTLVQEKWGRRQMQTRWTFKSADHYVETLFEKDASGNLVQLVDLNHHRSQPERQKIVTPPRPSSDQSQFKGLDFLYGQPWSSSSEDGKQLNLDWSLTWIPVANFLYGEVRENAKGNAQDHFHFFIYRDHDSKTLRFLALCHNSDVFTGEVNVASSGSVQFDLERSSSSTTEKLVSTIEKISAENLKQTFGILDSAKATGSTTILHKR